MNIKLINVIKDGSPVVDQKANKRRNNNNMVPNNCNNNNSNNNINSNNNNENNEMLQLHSHCSSYLSARQKLRMRTTAGKCWIGEQGKEREMQRNRERE